MVKWLTLTEKQIYDLNKMNRAAQNVQLGTLIQNMIIEIEQGGGQTNPAVIQRDSYLEFPNIGDINCVYADISSNTLYRWDNANKKYYLVGFNYEDVKNIIGGNSIG